jgi:hypothetical protein
LACRMCRQDETRKDVRQGHRQRTKSHKSPNDQLEHGTHVVLRLTIRATLPSEVERHPFDTNVRALATFTTRTSDDLMKDKDKDKRFGAGLEVVNRMQHHNRSFQVTDSTAPFVAHPSPLFLSSSLSNHHSNPVPGRCTNLIPDSKRTGRPD